MFNGKELDTETRLYYYGARYYDPRVSLWLNVDPMMLRDEAMDDEDSSNGGVFNPMNNAVYTFSYQNPVKYVDPDGECPNCITAAGGTLVGAIIGGGIEAGMQLYKDGKITSWKAIGGSAAQGAITSAAAGFTGGASLAVTVGVAGGANVVGGLANRAIQGKKTTVTDVVIDATIGAIFGAGGKVLRDIVKKSTNNLTNSAKGFSVAQSKYDYFFGRVTIGKQHNINRSAQNLKDLSTLGIKNEKQLTNIFSKAFEKGTVISTKTNEYGTTITKSIELSNKGAINVGFFYKGGNLNNKPTISTIIPKIYNK